MPPKDVVNMDDSLDGDIPDFKKKLILKKNQQSMEGRQNQVWVEPLEGDPETKFNGLLGSHRETEKERTRPSCSIAVLWEGPRQSLLLCCGQSLSIGYTHLASARWLRSSRLVL